MVIKIIITNSGEGFKKVFIGNSQINYLYSRAPHNPASLGPGLDLKIYFGHINQLIKTAILTTFQEAISPTRPDTVVYLYKVRTLGRQKRRVNGDSLS